MSVQKPSLADKIFNPLSLGLSDSKKKAAENLTTGQKIARTIGSAALCILVIPHLIYLGSKLTKRFKKNNQEPNLTTINKNGQIEITQSHSKPELYRATKDGGTLNFEPMNLLGKSTFLKLLKLNPEAIDKQLQSEPIGTYFFRQSSMEDGSISATIKTKEGIVNYRFRFDSSNSGYFWEDVALDTQTDLLEFMNGLSIDSQQNDPELIKGIKLHRAMSSEKPRLFGQQRGILDKLPAQKNTNFFLANANIYPPREKDLHLSELSREMAAVQLKSKPLGTYLFRKSEVKDDSITAALKTKDGVYEYEFKFQNGQYTLTSDFLKEVKSLNFENTAQISEFMIALSIIYRNPA